MSYIRATSNPEMLHIFGDSKLIEIYTGLRNSPLCNFENLAVPGKDFFELIKKYSDEQPMLDDPPVTVDDLTVAEHIIYEDDASIVDSVKFDDPRPSRIINKLSYKDKYICMWRVTWMYIVHNVMEELRREACNE